MSTQSVEVEPIFAQYLPDTIEDESDVEGAFRDAVQELHPDQSGADTAEEFDTVRKARDNLKNRVSDGEIYQVETQASIADIDIEESLERGVEWRDEQEDFDVDYDVMNGSMTTGLYSALMSDNNSELKIGLEIESNYDAPDESLDVEATYFTDRGGELETISGHIDLRQEISYGEHDEVNRQSMVEAVDSGIAKTGAWAAEYAEKEIK